MLQAALHLDLHHHVGPIDRRLFGGLIEHLGRGIYGGIYDPASPHADEKGLRRDVLEALRSLNLSLVRYPGGNFASNYDWRDGIAPPESRPIRPDLAWKSLESNRFGTDEFLHWCRQLGGDPYITVNLGNGTPQLAAEWVEYCNASTGPWADQRRANGQAVPYRVRLWGLGNEMDGPWQTGHCTADEYARRALAAARLMRQVDPSIQTIAAGSSGPFMPTYLAWDRTVLEHCWDVIDYLAVHHYSGNRQHNTAWYLAEGTIIDRILADYRGVISYVRGVKQSSKQVFLAFDEWNVWYRARGGEYEDGKWQHAPPLLEEHYNLEDALVCAQYLASFIRNADLVKIACLAQLVNVIAPILTRPDGLLIQPIYWPLALFSRYARGLSLVPVVDAPTCDAGERGTVPRLDAAASYDVAAGTLSVFLINRGVDEELSVRLHIADASAAPAGPVNLLSGLEPTATNTWAQPDVVRVRTAPAERYGDGTVRVGVPAPGLAVMRLQLHPLRHTA